MSVINILTVQGYYQLYALFFDYPINNDYYLSREDRERIRAHLRAVQPLLALTQPYRFDWRLRLFTQRQSLDRFSPEKVHELLRQLRNTVALIPEKDHPRRRAMDRRRHTGEPSMAHLPRPPPPQPNPREFLESPARLRLTA